MSWLSQHQIEELRFAEVGEHVLISDKASFHNTSKISLGNNVRIDDFSVLSAGTGGIQIGSYIHIAVFSSLIGAGEIVLGDFCNLSSRVSIYSSNDDYSGVAMTNPMVPKQYTNVKIADVVLGKHVIVGSGSIILPGVSIGQAVAIGALSVVNQDCDAFGIYVGHPAKLVKQRKVDLLALEEMMMAERSRNA